MVLLRRRIELLSESSLQGPIGNYCCCMEEDGAQVEVELSFMAPALTPEDPEFWVTQKRCIRCTKFYTEKDNPECW